ncbi:unnamed protein product [Vitrella brassicaformis CCMP3155]|uniref:non-specific serine/threonine protein kinase n=2 Tax=Vitrella brassicaformis TaxID=1169539 RepID=A0A0G4GE40_VITBC|nr:unnamed protein product [Vitrella brassicaformis CCMP3155]|eukprot:CEM27630.1 unnamed protein product [Vitrella brassicaformis CCMP3155]
MSDEKLIRRLGYERVRPIGRGQHGLCYLVNEHNEGKAQSGKGKFRGPFVAKLVDLGLLPENDRKMAYQEVELLERLQHDYIVGYRDSRLDSERDVLVTVMEFCEGGDLKELINQVAAQDLYLAEEQIMRWFVQLAQALAYLHSNRVLHRDLKTSNIFMTSDRQTAKIGDFGISRVLEGALDFAATTVGTPYYMSPEVCQNSPYSFKSDVWSLGCVLYELCMLKHAFDANSLLGLVYKIVSGSSPPIPPFYSKDLSTLIDKMLAKDAADRLTIDEVLGSPFVKDYLRVAAMEEQNLITHEAADAIGFVKVVKYTDGHIHESRLEISQRGIMVPADLTPEAAAALLKERDEMPTQVVPAASAAAASEAKVPEVPLPPKRILPIPEEHYSILVGRVRRTLVQRRLNWLHAFAFHDREGRGSLPFSEASEMLLVTLHLTLSREEVSLLLRCLDDRDDGCLRVDAFRAALLETGKASTLASVEQWAVELITHSGHADEVKPQFDQADIDGEGMLSDREFRRVMSHTIMQDATDKVTALVKSSDHPLVTTTDEALKYALNRIVHLTEKNGQGEVNYVDFLRRFYPAALMVSDTNDTTHSSKDTAAGLLRVPTPVMGASRSAPTSPGGPRNMPAPIFRPTANTPPPSFATSSSSLSQKPAPPPLPASLTKGAGAALPLPPSIDDDLTSPAGGPQLARSGGRSATTAGGVGGVGVGGGGWHHRVVDEGQPVRKTAAMDVMRKHQRQKSPTVPARH